MENNLGRKTVTPSLLTPIAKVNSSLPISYEFPLLDLPPNLAAELPLIGGLGKSDCGFQEKFVHLVLGNA